MRVLKSSTILSLSSTIGVLANNPSQSLDHLKDFDQALQQFHPNANEIYTPDELAAFRKNFDRHAADIDSSDDKTSDTKKPFDVVQRLQKLLKDAEPIQTKKKVADLKHMLKVSGEPWHAEESSRWYSVDEKSGKITDIVSTKIARYMQGTFLSDRTSNTNSLHDINSHNSSILAQPLSDIYTHHNMTLKLSDIPTSFDSRQQWGSQCPSLLHIRNQAACGSCWAHGSTESYNDRVCIKTGKKELLSTEHTTSCCGFFPCWSMGCNGGHPGLAWRWLVKGGVVTGGDYGDSKEYCWPYEVDPSSHTMAKTPSCRSTCKNTNYNKSFNDDRGNYQGGRAYMVHGIEAIKENIVKNGPVASAFIVYSDFMSYKGGVYTGPTAGAKVMGGHAIKIVGFGKTDEGLEYWIVANSWGSTWGEDGFFRINIGSKTGMDWGVSAGEVEEESSMKMSEMYV